MRILAVGVGAIVLGWSFCAAQNARANERFKGPEEDGTKAALTKIAGEGMMNSHAFEYLTELSDNVGARVTGSAEAQRVVKKRKRAVRLPVSRKSRGTIAIIPF